ncbi:sulfurtransferase complex subunit TusB [Amphritea japonica]|uniref:tRNA 2-thiouridine synthesizing protein B n=1 Tax=Amphritea japonica ATCC BAA-1530 TaxID=1278309 RepID=A0A7R6P3A6_9GAMM|nr:sulfurtransferase complex subunit TusB [Amphritea japonica]BBB26224.1 tRNA 2-thiouridine synthesizing protein B [Amphritea japonica ATCC BAA-1530]
MTLHTINKTPTESGALKDCLASLSDGDALLLIENGVYAAMPGYAELFTRLPASIQCYLLEEDASARGLKALNPDFGIIDYDGFVTLSCRYTKVLSWF